MNNKNSSYDLAEIADNLMLERDFQITLPANAQNELAQIQGTELTEQKEKVRDLRSLLWLSIDNDDTLDLDQLTYAEKLPANRAKIFVAIADVSVLVPKHSPLDQHAAWNTTSVYTPLKVFPMLPTKLSNNLTSLNYQEDRFAVVVEMIVEPDGSIHEYDVYRALVHNHAKLAYNGIHAWLEHQIPPPESLASVPGMEEQVRFQEQIAVRLRDYRQREGALGFKTVEVEPVIANGKVVDLKEVTYNRARALIEYFMIAANFSVTRFLDGKKFPVVRRIVRTPKDWDRIMELAAELGDHLPPQPDVKALSAFLRKRKQADPAQFPDLSLAIIKLIGRGEYVVSSPGKPTEGHFDLALQDYAHSTAPNRRYPDLIIQRLLKAVFAKEKPPYELGELNAIASRCTLKEDDATKVERRAKKSAAAVVLSSRINEQFDALVTGASEKGTWVRIFHPPLEGKLIQGYRGLKVGQRITVKLVSVDIPLGFIDFVRT